MVKKSKKTAKTAKTASKKSKKAAAPALGEGLSRKMLLRLSDGDMESFKKAAGAADKPTATWIRETLRAAAA